jgi:hypothetical protein
VDRVQRGVSEQPRVQVASSRPDRDAEPDHAARADEERGHAAPLEARVEDDARVRAPVVGRDPVDDRVAADLLLAVAGDPDVHRKRTLRAEQRGGLQQRIELALVVGDAARVEPLAADRGLERRALPELERRRRLDVEVPVDENRRRPVGAAGGPQLADDERTFAVGNEVGLTARGENEVAYPLAREDDVARVGGLGADARDAQELGELVQPGRIHGAAVY